MGKAKAARKSAKVLRISRSESEEEWDDETDGNNGVSEDEELDSEEDEDTMSVIQKKGPSDGIAVAEAPISSRSATYKPCSHPTTSDLDRSIESLSH